MKKVKKIISSILTITILTITLTVPVLADNKEDVMLKNSFEATEFTVETNGYVEHIFINENKEVFVNGRNITTIIYSSGK